MQGKWGFVNENPNKHRTNILVCISVAVQFLLFSEYPK